MKKIELTGQRFGRLLVLKRVATSKDGQKVYLCRCDCGNSTDVAVIDRLMDGVKADGIKRTD